MASPPAGAAHAQGRVRGHREVLHGCFNPLARRTPRDPEWVWGNYATEFQSAGAAHAHGLEQWDWWECEYAFQSAGAAYAQ